MKQIYLLAILILIIFKSEGQTVDTQVASSINDKFSLLEKNRIPHDILLDYGYDFIDITKFDGVIREDNLISVGRYNQIYTTIASSITQNGVNGVVPPIETTNDWKTLQKEAIKSFAADTTAIILSGLYFNYSLFNSNALSNNKISIVNGRYDDKYLNGVWQNPYETKSVFAISAPVMKINKPDVRVKLPSNLWHSNSNIKDISINFNGSYDIGYAGWASLKDGATISYRYGSPKVQTWTFRIELNNGEYLYCEQEIEFTQGSESRIPRMATPPTAIKSIKASRKYNGIAGSATLQINYGIDNELNNPLIVVEGLDTGLLTYSSLGDTDLENFNQSINISNSEELRNLITNPFESDLDIVYVNWDNGVDFLQRNAYVLEEVIKWVNENKTTSNSNVVLGQSMGGVIARYALKDMENRGEDHDTRLYVSHDAPHQGAHLPLGALYMARHISNLLLKTPLGGFTIPLESGDTGLATLDDLLDAPAVQQLLINNVNGNLQIDNTLHNSWQAELENIGYPQQTRNVALSNASHCANGYGLTSNQPLLQVSGKGSTSIVTDLLSVLIGSAVGYTFNDINIVFLGLLPGKSKLDANFQINAYPSSGTARIYNGRITYEKRLLWLVPIRRNITDRSYNSPNNVLFQDDFPGGEIPTGISAVEESDFESGALGKYGYNISIQPRFNFISSTSALDIGSGNTSLNTSAYRRIYTSGNSSGGSLSSPFDSFATSFNSNRANEPHISFNSANGDWLAEELDNDNDQDIFDCSFVCGGELSIQGPNTFCASGTYSVNASSGTTVNWSVSPSGALSFVQGSPSTTFTLNSGYQGDISISAVISSSSCGSSQPINKSIRVGTPLTYMETGAGSCYNPANSYCDLGHLPSSFSPGETVALQIKGFGTRFIDGYGDPDFEWERQDGDFKFVSSDPSGIIGYPQNNGQKSIGSVAILEMNNYSGNPITFRTRAKNECGWGSSKFYYWDAKVNGLAYSYSPNPATSEITVENYQTERQFESELTSFSHSEATTSEEGSIELYNFNNILVKSIEYNSEDPIFVLPVSDLAKGHYILRVRLGTMDNRHKIIIN